MPVTTQKTLGFWHVALIPELYSYSRPLPQQSCIYCSIILNKLPYVTSYITLLGCIMWFALVFCRYY